MLKHAICSVVWRTEITRFQFSRVGEACRSKTLLNDDRVEPQRSRISVHKSMVWEGECQRNHLLRLRALCVLSHQNLGSGQIN